MGSRKGVEEREKDNAKEDAGRDGMGSELNNAFDSSTLANLDFSVKWLHLSCPTKPSCLHLCPVQPAQGILSLQARWAQDQGRYETLIKVDVSRL